MCSQAALHSPRGGCRVSSYILLPLKLLMGFLPLSSIGIPRPSLVVLAAEMAFLSELTRTLLFCKPTSSPLATLHRWLASWYLICCWARSHFACLSPRLPLAVCRRGAGPLSFRERFREGGGHSSLPTDSMTCSLPNRSEWLFLSLCADGLWPLAGKLRPLLARATQRSHRGQDL